MPALPRLQDALESAVTVRRRSRARVALPIAAALATVGAIAVAASAPEDAEREAVSVPSGVVGQPVERPVPAGKPAKGRLELRATDPERAGTLAGLYFTDDGGPCLEIGRERVIVNYPVDEGGSCLDEPLARLAIPFSYGLTSGQGLPTIVHGFARKDVRELLVDGPGGRMPVPRSAHGAWFVAYPKSAHGTVVLTARMKDGSTHTASLQVPMDPGPPVTTGPGRPDDPVTALIRPRKAAVTELDVRPRFGTPDTTFELAVPPAPPRDLYAVSLSGPGGKDCQKGLKETFGVNADSRRGRIRPLPPHRQAPFQTIDTPDYDEQLRTAPWCPGTYRLKVRYVKHREKGRGNNLDRFTFKVR